MAERKQLPQTKQQTVGLMALKEALNKPIEPKVGNQINKLNNEGSAFPQLGDVFITVTEKRTNPIQISRSNSPQVGLVALRDTFKKPSNKLNCSFECQSDSDSGIVSNRSSIISEDIRASITLDEIDGTDDDNSKFIDNKASDTDHDTSKDSVLSGNDIHIGGGITGIVEAINKLQNDLMQMTSYLDHESNSNPSCDKIGETFREEPRKFVTEKYLELAPCHEEPENDEAVEVLQNDSDTEEDSDTEDFLINTSRPVSADEWSLGNIGLKKPVPQASHPRGAKGAMFSMSFVTNGQIFSGNKRK